MTAKLMILTLAIWLFEGIVFLSISDRPWRFSLSTLLLAVTMTAVVMGLIAALGY